MNLSYQFAEDNLHYEQFQDGTVKCIEDEIPFEIPNGWAWSRLKNLSAVIQYGLSNSAEHQGTHRLLRITDIQNGKVNWDNVPFTTADDPTSYLLKVGDIVFARTGATVGKSFLITETPYPSVYASYLIRIRLLGNLSSEYIYQFFNSAYHWNQITDKSVGVGQPNCNGTSLKELLIPLPPINEQFKIILTAQSLLEYIAEIDIDKKRLLSITSNAKSKILDLAIRGKLVPQDPNDEPASTLLERIRAEKEELIKQGKIKPDKRESVIFKGEDNSYYEKIGDTVNCIDDEIPFGIPENWCFSRLSDLSYITMGSSPKSQDVCKDGKFTEFHQGKIYFSDKIINQSTQFTKTVTKTAPEGSVLLCVRAPVGEVNITDRKICIGRGLASIKPLCNMSAEFIFYWLQNYKSFLINQSTGSTFSAINSDTVKNLLIPIPPLSEQRNVVIKIKEIFSLVECISDFT